MGGARAGVSCERNGAGTAHLRTPRAPQSHVPACPANTLSPLEDGQGLMPAQRQKPYHAVLRALQLASIWSLKYSTALALVHHSSFAALRLTPSPPSPTRVLRVPSPTPRPPR